MRGHSRSLEPLCNCNSNSQSKLLPRPPQRFWLRLVKTQWQLTWHHY